jgi:DNA-binding CsgD family transcriptional regulator
VGCVTVCAVFARGARPNIPYSRDLHASPSRGIALPHGPPTIDVMVRNPLGTKGVTAEAAIARLSLKSLPALDLFERIAIPFRRAVPYSAGCWKQMDPRTLLWTGFGLEDGTTGALAAARSRFVDNELLDRDYAKYRELVRRRTPVTTLHRETRGEPERSSRHREINRSLGFGAELRAMFCAGGVCWGSVALVRDEGQADFSDQELAFVARVGEHVAHGLREALLRETAVTAVTDRAPGVIVLDADGSVRSLTDQATFWLQQFPADRRSGLELPAAVHAVAKRTFTAADSRPEARPHATVRLTSGGWLTVHAATLRTGPPDETAVAVTLAPAAVPELEALRLALHGLTPREREVAQLLTRGATNDEIARTLWISRHTVRDHVKAIYTKLEVASRAELSAKLFHEHIAPQLDSQRIREFAAVDTN